VSPLIQYPSGMAASVKEGFTKEWNLGKLLYQENCSNCHNVRKGRKQIIPYFPPEKLAGYAFADENKEHQNAFTRASLSTEEIIYIGLFLQYQVHTTADTVKSANH
jgi:hypothetical protein